MDASNMMKPALARGELRCIGCTTEDEYAKHIEKDSAFERRFQKVTVKETIGRGHNLDSPWTQTALRNLSWRPYSRLGARPRGQVCGALYSPSLFAR